MFPVFVDVLKHNVRNVPLDATFVAHENKSFYNNYHVIEIQL